MTPDKLREDVSEAFNRHAAAGITAYAGRRDATVLSHVCFKFDSMEAYRETIESAKELGTVTQEEFNGKEISWCKLATPLEKGLLKLEWLEFVEPRSENHPFTGVSSIGYAVAGLTEPVKIPSDDDRVVYRYQGKHASELAKG
jgi:hypothetical protein